jgi:hypothetical protein
MSLMVQKWNIKLIFYAHSYNYDFYLVAMYYEMNLRSTYNLDDTPSQIVPNKMGWSE